MDVPVQCQGLEGKPVNQIACGRAHVVAIVETSKLLSETKPDVYSWGCGLQGQLGRGNRVTQLLPRLVEPLQGIQVNHIAAGGNSSACVLATGEVYTWGCNKYGQLGISMIHHDEHASDLGSAYLHPQLVLGLISQDVKTVCVGSQHMTAVCAHHAEELPPSVRSEHSELVEEAEPEEVEEEAVAETPVLDLTGIRKKTSVYVADSHSRRETPQSTFRGNAVGAK